MEQDKEFQLYCELIGIVGDYNMPSTLNPVTHYIDDILSKNKITPNTAIHILIKYQGAHSQETYKNLTTPIIKYLKELNNIKPEFKRDKITEIIVDVNKIEQGFRDKIDSELKNIESRENKIEYLKEKLTEYKTKIITPQVQALSGTHLQEIYPVTGALYSDKYILDLIDGLERQTEKSISKDNSSTIKLNLTTTEKRVIKDVFHTLQNGKLVEGKLSFFKQALISGTTDCYVNWSGTVTSLNYFLKQLFNYKNLDVNWQWGVKVFLLKEKINPEKLRNARGVGANDQKVIDKALEHLKCSKTANNTTQD